MSKIYRIPNSSCFFDLSQFVGMYSYVNLGDTVKTNYLCIALGTESPTQMHVVLNEDRHDIPKVVNDIYDAVIQYQKEADNV